MDLHGPSRYDKHAGMQPVTSSICCALASKLYLHNAQNTLQLMQAPSLYMQGYVWRALTGIARISR